MAKYEILELDPSQFLNGQDPATITNWGPVLNRMFAEAERIIDADEHDNVLIYYTGTYETEEEVVARGDGCTFFPGHIVATVPLDVIYREKANYATYVSTCRVTGTGSSVFDKRTCLVGALIEDGYNSVHLGGFRVHNTLRHAVSTEGPGQKIGWNGGMIVARDIGSRAKPHPTIGERYTDVLELVPIARVDTGTQSNNTQVSTVTIDPDVLNDPITGEQIYDLVRILALGDPLFFQGEYYQIRGVSPTTVELFPQIRDYSIDTAAMVAAKAAAEEGTGAPLIMYPAPGAGLNVQGGNTTGIVASLEVQRAGTALRLASLYGGVFKVTGQSLGVGLQVGHDTPYSHKATTITHFHPEDVQREVVRPARGTDVHVNILQTVTFKADKIEGVTSWGINGPINEHYADMDGIVWNYTERYSSTQIQRPRNGIRTVPDLRVSNRPGTESTGLIDRDSPTLTVYWEDDLDRNFAYNSARFIMRGTDGGSPGPITLVAAPGGGTIEGQAIHTVPDPGGRAELILTRLVDAEDWMVDCRPLSCSCGGSTP